MEICQQKQNLRAYVIIIINFSSNAIFETKLSIKSVQLTEYVIQICAENRILKSYASNFSTANLSISINGIGKMSIAGLGHQIQLL